MKLSDAIALIGATKPQGFGTNSFNSCDMPCALGGAMQAIGKQDGSYTTVMREWPWLSTQRQCPVCGSLETTMTIVWELNDDHRWTRQQIAEWVATVEPKKSPIPVASLDIKVNEQSNTRASNDSEAQPVVLR